MNVKRKTVRFQDNASDLAVYEAISDYKSYGFRSESHMVVEAVKQVIHDQVSDPKLDGMGKLLIPLTGAIFAKDVKKILFGETEENKED